MGFEFTGEPPALGSSPFATTSTAPTTSSHRLSFGFDASSTATPPFQPSRFPQSQTPGVSSSISQAPPSKTVAIADDFTTTFPDRKQSDDAISRALQRAKVKRPAIFGNTEVAADSILGDYLDGTYAHSLEGCSSLRDLTQALKSVAETNPEAMRFVRYLFEKTTSTKTTGCAHVAPGLSGSQCYGNEQDENGQQVFEMQPKFDAEIGLKDTRGRPSSFRRLPESGPFYHELYKKAQSTLYKHRMTRFLDPHAPPVITEGIIRGDDKAEMLCEIRLRGYGGQLPAQERPPAQVDVVHDMYDETWRLYEEHKGALEGDENDEMSYFGARSVSKLRGKQTAFWDKPEPPRESCCGERPLLPTTLYRKAYSGKPFDFMGLPPELRMRVYQFALAPKVVSLRSCAHHIPRGVTPILTPGLLGVSRQVKREADFLLEDNTFIVNVYLQNVTRSTIHRNQIPPHFLPKITSLVLVLDVVDADHGLADYRYPYDWRQVQALTSLKRLRITGITRHADPASVLRWRDIIGQIVERVPLGCSIEYGTESKLQRDHVRDMARAVENAKSRWVTEQGRDREVIEADVDVLKEAAAGLPTLLV